VSQLANPLASSAPSFPLPAKPTQPPAPHPSSLIPHPSSLIQPLHFKGIYFIKGFVQILPNNAQNDEFDSPHHLIKEVIMHNGNSTMPRIDILINALPDFVNVKDGQGKWVEANSVALDVFHIPKDAVYKGKSDSELAEYAPFFAEALRYCEETDDYVWSKGCTVRAEEVIPQPDGSVRVFDTIKVPIFHDDGSRRLLIVVGRDISEQKRNEQIIHHMAFYDTLTGLANRALLSKTVSEALDDQSENDSSVAVLFIDLDNFKTWNDTKGHSIGDELLKQVAERLRSCVRSNQDMICRLGGDEFIILLPEVDDFADASVVAKRIIKQFSEPWDIAGERVFITASIGIAMATEGQMDADSLIRNADIAMYEAKRKGKNTYRFFDQKLNEQVRHRFEIERALRRAFEKNEFTLYYQPQVNAVTHKLTGAEVLIRWIRPGYGIVPPSEFIGIAEECGFIIPLGKWVIRETCKQIKEWAAKGQPPFRVSINISPRQFQDEELVEYFRETLQDTGVKGEWLGVEITESVIVPDIEYAQKTLHALRQMGIKIDIDDFGTGYSSFGYLMDFPVDRIKIDKSFVCDISEGKVAAIVKSIIALAKNLNMSSIAEGVESQSQSEVLAIYGCNELQGYFINEPVPASEFLQYINARQAVQ
jgi:diguanylate cyclase (GGDEF)-like protein